MIGTVKHKNIIHTLSVNALKAFVFLGIISFGRFASAIVEPCAADQICNPITSSTFVDFIQKASDQIMKIGLPIAAMSIIYAGLKLVMARGNEKELEPAKEMLKWTIIGTAVLLGAWALVNAIYATMQTL